MPRIVGQEVFQDRLNKLTEIPRLMILEAPSGAGKKTLAKEIAEHKLFGKIMYIGNNVDAIRNMIEQAIGFTSPIVFYILEADNMSIGASNALLKIAEEPTANMYIIIGTTNSAGLLSTIRSRGSLFRLDCYRYSELADFAISKGFNTDDLTVIDALSLATNPGEFLDIIEGGEELFSYVDKVIDNILTVSTGNAFKVVNKLSFKEAEKGIPIDLFMRVLQSKLLKESIITLGKPESIKYCLMSKCCSQAIREMNNKSVNKKMVFDVFVLDIRRIKE